MSTAFWRAYRYYYIANRRYGLNARDAKLDAIKWARGQIFHE